MRPIDERLGRSAGALPAQAGRSDVMDAAVVLVSRDGDDTITSDPADLSRLAAASGRHVELLHP